MYTAIVKITNELSDVWQLLVGAFHYTILKSWYDLKKLLKHMVFPTFPEYMLVCCLQCCINMPYSSVNVSSGWSLSSPIRNIPLMRRELTVHKAWTVRPKCWPWWTRGSVPQLIVYQNHLDGKSEVKTRAYSLFLSPSCNAPGRLPLDIQGGEFPTLDMRNS